MVDAYDRANYATPEKGSVDVDAQCRFESCPDY